MVNMCEKMYTSATLDSRTSQDGFLVGAADGNAPLEVMRGSQEAEGELRADSTPASDLGTENGAPSVRTSAASSIAREAAMIPYSQLRMDAPQSRGDRCTEPDDCIPRCCECPGCSRH
jgi:hypothetical protein